jgi:hypothetical protein
MVEKDSLGNLEDDLSPRQCQFLLELSSALPDIMPLPGITFAQMTQSNDAINLLMSDIVLSFAHSISAS